MFYRNLDCEDNSGPKTRHRTVERMLDIIRQDARLFRGCMDAALEAGVDAARCTGR